MYLSWEDITLHGEHNCLENPALCRCISFSLSEIYLKMWSISKTFLQDEEKETQQILCDFEDSGVL